MEAGEHTRIRMLRDESSVDTEPIPAPHRLADAKRDLLLVRRLLARDESAWCEFVSQYRRLFINRIHAAASELNSGLPASDIVEEICADVFSVLVSREMESLRQFSGRSRLSTWLSVVVRRTALRVLANAQRRPHQPDTAELDMIPQSDGSAARSLNMSQDHVRDGMQHLSTDECRLLAMYYEKQQSYEQIANAFQISVNAVGPKLDRARKRLKKILESRSDR